MTIRFVAPATYAGFLAVMIAGAADPLVTCTVEDAVASFTCRPQPEDSEVRFRVLDSSRFYGEARAEILRGIAANDAFDDRF